MNDKHWLSHKVEKSHQPKRAVAYTDFWLTYEQVFPSKRINSIAIRKPDTMLLNPAN